MRLHLRSIISGSGAWRSLSVLLATVLLLSGSVAAAPSGPQSPAVEAPALQTEVSAATEPLATYVVRLGESDLMLTSDPVSADQDERAWQARYDEVAATLDTLAAAGSAGTYTYDEVARAFRVDLAASARGPLAANPHVAYVEPWHEGALAPAAIAEPEGGPLDWQGVVKPQDVASGVSSVIFVQVDSPFMWGRVNVGGLSVRLWLEDENGTVIGGATQVAAGSADGQRCSATPTLDAVKIDPGQLYFETVFLSCDSGTPVMIRPGHKVHITTIGDNPATPGDDPDEDKRITVDMIDAWTSYENDRVDGVVRDADGLNTTNKTVVVTVTTGGLSLGTGYITPGSSVTYAEVTASDSGNFAATQFRTSTDPTLKTVNMDKGSRGFVRVIHANGDEVYSLHGQNVLVLENSDIVHGYAYPLPSAPSGLVSSPRITVSRPATSVEITLKAPGGATKASGTVGSGTPYTLFMGADIVGGDSVEVSINGGPVNRMVTVPITNTVDVDANQVVGTAAPNRKITVGVGRISGYVTSNSTYTYLHQVVDSAPNGSFQSGQIKCGTSSYLDLAPGSFGYTGYEDARGNFIYAGFAAPANYAMIDYPLVEGWVADGLVRPTITVRDASNAITSQSTAAPMVTWLTNLRLYLNLYYAEFTNAYIAAGDTVEVAGGGTTASIPVPSEGLTSNLNDESNVVSGVGPANASLRVIPIKDRASRKDVTADASGRFGAENPYTTLNLSTCGEGTKTHDFVQGDTGRVYLRYPDGNEVFAFWGRGMSVNENENRVEVWIYAQRNIDWLSGAQRLTSVTLTPKSGTAVTSSKLLGGNGNGYGLIEITDAGANRVLIRSGDSLQITFDEGPNGLTRQATMELNSVPLLTASADTDNSTVAGVGPTTDFQHGRVWSGGGWLGRAWTVSPTASKVVTIPTRASVAYPPVSFVDSGNRPITLVYGYAGRVSFSDDNGRKVWVAWAVPAEPVKIYRPVWAGATTVCGKAPPSSPVVLYTVVYDEVNETIELIEIGTGSSGADGKFCITVGEPLVLGQVIMAESLGTYSQPVIVMTPVFVPMARR